MVIYCDLPRTLAVRRQYAGSILSLSRFSQMYHLSFYKLSLLLFVLFSSLDALLGERFTGKLQGSYRG